MQLTFGALTQNRLVQRTAALWTFRRWRNTICVGEMLDELKCNIVDILFWCFSFINCFGFSKEPSQEMVLLSVSNMCFRCEIEKRIPF